MDAQIVRYEFDSVEVEPAAFAVKREGRQVELEPKAVRVLVYLIEHRDRAISKEELMHAVWGDTAVTDNALTRIIAQIRRELGDDARQPRFIETLPTMGYRFVAAHFAVREGHARHASMKRRALAAMAAVLMLAGLGWLLFRQGVLGGIGELHAVQLTTSPGLDIGASMSPDGRWLVYSSNRSGQFEIYKRPVSSQGGDIQLTRNGNQNVEPGWSPDGKWIVYHSVAQRGIWVLPVSGGPARRLTAFGSMPVWSPGGRQIAFSSAEPLSFTWYDLPGSGARPATIWMLASDGSELRQVTTDNQPPGQHMMPAWSPDGKELAFVAVSRESAIWKLHLPSGALDRLIQVGREIPRANPTRFNILRDPKFSPTGGGLYFSARNGQGEYAIYWLRRRGERPRQLYTTRGEAPSGIHLSVDGKHLAFTRLLSVSQIWTTDATGGPRALVQEAVLRAYRPSYSPDGKLLAFLVDTMGHQSSLWMMNADGSGAAPVSSDPGAMETTSVWNLEGTGALYTYFDGARVEFRRYDTIRKTSRVLAAWPWQKGPSYLVLMPDEQEVLSVCSRPMNLCFSPVRGGAARQITFERERAAFPNVSRDGQWVVFGVWRNGVEQIGITDRQGGHQEILTDDPNVHFPNAFSPDGRRISYASFCDGVWNIWWIDRITRERKQMTHLTTYGPYVRFPAWRPGSEEMVYEYSQVKGNIYVLDLP